MEEYSRIPMGRTIRIIRRSIYVFLQNYQRFTTTAALFTFPFAALALLSEASVPSSFLIRVIHSRSQSLFDAAGFPRSSEVFTVLNLKLSQTIATYFIVVPFTLTFLLLAKAFIIQLLNYHKPASKPAFASFLSLYNPLLLTQLCNISLIISANAICFSLLYFAFHFIGGLLGFSSSKLILFFSASGAVLYSIILSNALIICNLALILSGTEKCGGYIAIVKACVLIRGKSSTALSLALPVNMVLAAVEALFQYRIVGAYHHAQTPFSAMALEAMFITYLYAILIVLDTVVGCVFYRSCKSASHIDQEGLYSYRIEIKERDGSAYASLKTLEELP